MCYEVLSKTFCVHVSLLHTAETKFVLSEGHTFGAKKFILVGVVGPFTLFCIFLEGRKGKRN